MCLGTTAPGFALPDTVSGRTIALAEVRGAHGTLVMFLCNHCPYVQHVNVELVRVASIDYIGQPVADAHPTLERATDLKFEKLTVLSIAPLLAKAIGYTHGDLSVSSLFE